MLSLRAANSPEFRAFPPHLALSCATGICHKTLLSKFHGVASDIRLAVEPRCWEDLVPTFGVDFCACFASLNIFLEDEGFDMTLTKTHGCLDLHSHADLSHTGFVVCCISEQTSENGWKKAAGPENCRFIREIGDPEIQGGQRAPRRKPGAAQVCLQHTNLL